MGDEFIASLDNHKHLSLEKIADELCSKHHYVLERSSPKKISLRISDKERQPNWPEDFTICSHDDDLLLTIHSSTRRKRTKIVGDIQSICRRQGVLLSFQEV
jgi:hypothetical protein